MNMFVALLVNSQQGYVHEIADVTISVYFGQGGLDKQWGGPPHSPYSRVNTGIGTFNVLLSQNSPLALVKLHYYNLHSSSNIQLNKQWFT